MLLRLGIASDASIASGARPAIACMPDGQGREATISDAEAAARIGDCRRQSRPFSPRRIGFADTATRRPGSRRRSRGYRRHAQPRALLSPTVASVAPAGDAEVFDAAIPGLNAFDANGSVGAQLRRAAVAALRRLPAWARSTWRALVRGAVHRRRRGSTSTGCARLVPDCVRMMDNVVDISQFPLPQQTAGGAAEAAHRARRHRARRRADPVRAALRLGGGGGGDRGMARRHRARGLSRLGGAGRGKGPVPALRSRALSRRRDDRRPRRRMCATQSAGTACATRS